MLFFAHKREKVCGGIEALDNVLPQILYMVQDPRYTLIFILIIHNMIRNLFMQNNNSEKIRRINHLEYVIHGTYSTSQVKKSGRNAIY